MVAIVYKIIFDQRAEDYSYESFLLEWQYVFEGKRFSSMMRIFKNFIPTDRFLHKEIKKHSIKLIGNRIKIKCRDNYIFEKISINI